MNIEDAAKTFEYRFDRVVQFDPAQARATHAPNGAPYVVVALGGLKAEGVMSPLLATTEEAAVKEWLRAANAFADAAFEQPIDAQVLYWRVRPELDRQDFVPANTAHAKGAMRNIGQLTLVRVYSRLQVGRAT